MAHAQQRYMRSRFRLPGLFILSFVVLIIIIIELATALVLFSIHLFTYIQLFSFWFPSILPPSVVILIGGIIVGTSQSRTLRKYIQMVQLQQEWFYKVYTPLSISSDAQETSIALHESPTQNSLPSFEEFVQQRAGPVLLLGAPGAGKTTLLRIYQHSLATRLSNHRHNNDRIPVFILLKDYNQHLSYEQAYKSLKEYLYTDEVEGAKYLHPYFGKWFEQGRLLFLCDGLHEVDSQYLPSLCNEFRAIMQDSQNSVYITCDEMAYHEQPLLSRFVSEIQAHTGTIAPLHTDQIEQFVAQYINAEQPGQLSQPWTFSLDEILHLVNDLGLRKYCTNPSLLFLLMKTVHAIAPDDRQHIQTRGLLLQAMISHSHREQSEIIEQLAAVEDELMRFISQLAGVARRMKHPEGMRLGNSPLLADELRNKRTYRELASILEKFFIAPPIDEELLTDEDEDTSLPAFSLMQIANMLELAENTGLITISPNNLVRFSYALYEEYFTADYLRRVDAVHVQMALPFEKELLADVKNWHKPLRMWASLLPDPTIIENRLADAGHRNTFYAASALTLGIMCVNARVKASSSQYVLPSSLEELLKQILRDNKGIDILVEVFTLCAQEYGVEVYRFLLPLVRLYGIDTLFLKLEKQAVAELLFSYLREAIDQNPYGVVPILINMLGRLGDVVVPLAITASQPVAGLTSSEFAANMTLRKYAINILGRTHEPKAIEPLIIYLREGSEIGDDSLQALQEMGPGLALEAIVKELTNHTGTTSHRIALQALQNFLVASSPEHSHYEKIIETLLHTLSSTYTIDIQQHAKFFLLQEARSHPSRTDRVIKLAVYRLIAPNTDTAEILNIQFVLEQIGKATTLHLLASLGQQSEAILSRIIQVLDRLRDERALPALVALIAPPYDAIRQQVATCLVGYRQLAVPHLVQVILSTEKSDREAQAAFSILKEIGEATVEYIAQELSHIVPGRTQLLVRVLEHANDIRAVPSLLELLKLTQKEHLPQLASVVIQTLGKIPDNNSIPPLLNMLTYTGIELSFSSLADEVSKALSAFNKVGLNELLAALDSEQETVVTRGVRSALFLMNPFPQQQLLDVFAHCNVAHARQIILVFRSKGSAVAPFLVEQFCRTTGPIKQYVQQTLDTMDEQHIIQALVDANHTQCRSEIARYLRRYPKSAIAHLVPLLSDQQQGDAAVVTLTEFGSASISALAPALNEPRNNASQRAQGIIDNLVRQHVELLPEVFRLFHLLASPNEQPGYKALLQVLTNQLAEISTPALLTALSSQDLQVRMGVVQALVLLIRKDTMHSKVVLEKVSIAFVEETQRSGAMDVLKMAGEKAVDSVALLLGHEVKEIRQAAMEVMSKIGTPALDTVVRLMNDAEPARREMGEDILYGMKTDVIFNTVIELLASPDLHKVETALTLLLGRVRTDATHSPTSASNTDQKIIPALLEHIHTQNRTGVHLRIMAFLLLLPKGRVVAALRQILLRPPYTQTWLEWLTPLFLMLGMESKQAKEVLVAGLQNSSLPSKLRIEIACILGMMETHPIVEGHVAFLGRASDIPHPIGSLPMANDLELAQRALGGLLAGGKWNANTLRIKQRDVPDETGLHELYSILLGESYIPKIKLLRQKLQDEQQAHANDIQVQQAQITQLTEEREQWRSRFNAKKNELDAKKRELENVNTRLRSAEAINTSLEQQVARLQGEIAARPATINRRRPNLPY